MILTSDKALDAINDMLAAIGEAPVNTLDNSENVDVINAIRVLDKVNRQVQSKGWSFNHIEDTYLNPDIFTNKIKWQDDILYLVGTDGTKYIQKGDYVYDFDNQTDTFESAIEVEMIRLVDFEYMPVPVRDYIVAKASRIFQTQTLNDDSIGQNLVSQEQEAWATLQEYEMELGDYAIFDLQNIQTLESR
nr:tail protein [Autographiviridae sp.]